MVNRLVAEAAYPKLENMSILPMYYTNPYVSLKPSLHSKLLSGRVPFYWCS
jgi:hypothetical protein